MELNSVKEKTLDSDYWDIRVSIDDEVILAKQGTKLIPFTEVLLIAKKYIETKNKINES